MDFFHCWKHYYGLWAGILARNYGYKVNMPYWCICFLHTSSFCLHKTLIYGLESFDCLWITLIFLSAVWTFILMTPIHYKRSHWWAGDVKLNFSKFVQWKKNNNKKINYGTIPLNNCSDFIWGFFLYCWYVKHIPTLFLWVPGGFLFHGLQIELQ